VRFTDGAGILYNPATAQIVLDTVAPATTASPAPSTFINGVNVALSASEPGSTIRYTLNGSDPANAANNPLAYTGPIGINATTTVRYYATDIAGNAETPKSGIYTITPSSINASVTINGGAPVTNNALVNLAISATGVVLDKMSFSNNGITYTTPENYAVSKSWTLSAGDGVKTVFVRFHNTGNSLTYDPVTAQIVLDTAPPATTASPAPSGTPWTAAIRPMRPITRLPIPVRSASMLRQRSGALPPTLPAMPKRRRAASTPSPP